MTWQASIIENGLRKGQLRLDTILDRLSYIFNCIGNVP